MSAIAITASLGDELQASTADFYRRALRALDAAGVRCLVGGAFAHACYTGIRRWTKDLDLFILRADYERVAQVAVARGWRAEMTDPHWLAKIWSGSDFIDLIFNSGNGVTPVDERWFEDEVMVDVLGVPARLVRAEDSLLSKAFIMERERFDGADVAHLIQAQAEHLDWPSLLARFGPHWRVLLAHLTLFGYIYPADRHRLPAWLMDELTQRLARDNVQPPHERARVCAGTLLSREQYLHDVEHLGYMDGRLTPASTMTPKDVAHFTARIPGRGQADH